MARGLRIGRITGIAAAALVRRGSLVVRVVPPVVPGWEAAEILASHHPQRRRWRWRRRWPWVIRSTRYCGWCGGQWPCSRYAWALQAKAAERAGESR